MRAIKTEIINTPRQIGDLVDRLVLHHAGARLSRPAMYIDFEGVNLSREGSLSIFTLLFDDNTGSSSVYLIDVCTLGGQAFSTTGCKGRTLKNLLEDDNIPKVFFDARSDSDALFAHFGVALQGVRDLQLMESATRKTTSSRRCLSSLVKCVEQNAPHGEELTDWIRSKEKAKRLFSPKHGGSYEVFERRPIPDEIAAYCAGDVYHLPTLWDKFKGNTNEWRALVNNETKKRIEASQGPEYKPNGPDRALAPWSKYQNETLDAWNTVRVYSLASFRDIEEYGEDYILRENEDAANFDGYHWDAYDDDYDNGPTNSREVLNESDWYELYSD